MIFARVLDPTINGGTMVVSIFRARADTPGQTYAGEGRAEVPPRSRGYTELWFGSPTLARIPRSYSGTESLSKAVPCSRGYTMEERRARKAVQRLSWASVPCRTSVGLDRRQRVPDRVSRGHLFSAPHSSFLFPRMMV